MNYNGSIKNRLIAIILTVTLFTGFIGYGSFLFWYMNNQYNELIDKSKTLSLILGQDIAKLVFLNELSAAADISTKLKSFRTLKKMVLYKLDETPLYQYSSDNKSFLPKKIIKENFESKTEVKGDIFNIYIKANYQNTHLGYISLSFKVETLSNVIAKNSLMALYIILLMFGLSYSLAVYYARKFTNPILNLVEFLDKVESSASLKYRINIDEKNEYGKLYDGVNTMLDRIESTHNVLKIASVAFETQSGMLITDENSNILRVNKAFTKITGYESYEVLGKTPAILKSGLHDKSFYNKMFKVLKTKKYWSGEINNRKKNGNIINEQLIIQAVNDEKGKIKYFVASFLDITEHKTTEERLREKENILIHQSKMAAMGEMIGNIAHQWRQPLSVISTATTGMIISEEHNLPKNKDEDLRQLNNINNTVQYLSQTIDDFRNFFKTNKNKNIFNIKQSYHKTLKLIDARFSSLDIELIEDLTDIEIETLENELMQVFLNILNNARDALENIKNQRRLIFVDIKEKDENVIFRVTDNAGGVPEEILDRIFEPYFTTKHKSSGTGIGLYMSLEMVLKHMKGELNIYNKNYTYDGIDYKGACFTIMLPKNI